MTHGQHIDLMDYRRNVDFMKYIVQLVHGKKPIEATASTEYLAKCEIARLDKLSWSMENDWENCPQYDREHKVIADEASEVIRELSTCVKEMLGKDKFGDDDDDDDKSVLRNVHHSHLKGSTYRAIQVGSYIHKN